MKRALVIVTLLLIIGAAVAILVPLPRTVVSDFVLVAHARVNVQAPREGVFTEVTPAGYVNKGATLARYDLAPLEAKKAQLEKQIASLTKQLHAPPNPNAATNLLKAEAALKAAKTALGKARPAKKAAATKKVKAAEAALEKAKAALPKPAFELEKPLAEANMVLESVTSQLAAPTVTAPLSGVFAPTAEVGKPIAAHDVIGTVEDSSRLKAQVTVPKDEPLTHGQVAVLLLPKSRKRVSFDGDASSGIAEAEFDNAKGELKAGLKGTAEIEGAPRTLVDAFK